VSSVHLLFHISSSILPSLFRSHNHSGRMSQALLFAFVGAAAGQSAYYSKSLNQSVLATTTTFNGSTVPNPTAFSQQLDINVDDLWNLLVGPVSSASITTTVTPTPVPLSSLVPPPPLYYSPFPTGQQQPLETKNESWSFPKDFCKLFPLLPITIAAEGAQGGVWHPLPSRSRVQ
jgi:hypothetical protein